jgi:hemerythrin-like domain-containing protein
MKRDRFARWLSVFAIGFVFLIMPAEVFGHCDGMDGPVVKAAQQALAKSDVNLVLIWVSANDETEIRKVFAKTLAVRKLNAEARELADRCHLGKEETFLFPALIHRGVPSHGCPIGGLTMEHHKGRRMVGELANANRGSAAGEPPAREDLVKSLRALVAFYPNHIWKEDYLLFPLADKVLTPQDQQELMDEFETVERELGLDVHDEFDKVATELEQKVSGIVSKLGKS